MYEISINKPNKTAKIHKIGCPQIKKMGTNKGNQEYIGNFATLIDVCNYTKKYYSTYNISCCGHCIKNINCC